MNKKSNLIKITEKGETYYKFQYPNEVKIRIISSSVTVERGQANGPTSPEKTEEAQEED